MQLKKIALWGSIAIGAAVITGIAIIFYLSKTLPSIDQISSRELIESTKIYDRTGENLLYEIHGEEKRTALSSEDIPDTIRKATIAIEDDGFYDHPAIDIQAIMRSVIVDILQGRKAQGGSTITQQLAKNAFLTNEKSITRKLKELVLAYRIEKIYTKDEILDLYLNQIPYGQNAYGIEAAAQTYFGHPAKDLTVAEASMLAAIPQAPSYYSPWGTHAAELEDRRLHIIKRMKDLGFIDSQEAIYSSDNKPKIMAQPKKASFAIAPHFSMYIEEYLNDKYGEDMVMNGGLKVTTTLDKNLQEIANKAVKENAERNTELYEGHNGALIAEDPKTGQILAMVGSKDYFADSEPVGCISGRTCRFEGNFNIITQALRQPGSSFKPFAYLAAFTKGFTPDTILFDVPTEFSTNDECSPIPDYYTDNPKCYHPENFDHVFKGPITLKESLSQSVNVTAVKTLYLAGFDYTLDLVEKLGLTTLRDKSRIGLSLVLGGGEVRPIEMAEAYSVIAADGIKHKQASILKVEDKKGRILEEYKDEEEKVVEPNFTRLITDILSDRNLRSPLFLSSLSLTEVPGYQVALKTGTTNNYIDTWAFGYTPNLVVGVWAGNNDRYALGKGGSSILAAIPMWHAFISEAVKIRPNETFSDPEPIAVDLPIMRGEIDRNNIHNILFFLNRLDDSQYNNWEEGVQNWIRTNVIPDISASSYSYAAGQNPSVKKGNVSIALISPLNGDFIKADSTVFAEAESNEGISKIEIYLNNNLIGFQGGNLGNKFNFSVLIGNLTLKSQNIITVKATDNSNMTAEIEVIVFR